MNISTQIKIISTGYNDSPTLRGLVLAIPFIGSQLDVLFSAPAQNFMEQRIYYFLDQLKEQLSEIEENAIDIRFLETEEGYDLFTKTFNAALKTRQKEKIRIFAKILKGALLTNQKVHEAELYSKIVDDLTDRELEIALLLYDVKVTKKIPMENSKDGKTMVNDAAWFSHHYPQFTNEEITYMLIRIEKTGLIKELTGMFFGYTGGRYYPTPLFSSFVNFVGGYG